MIKSVYVLFDPDILVEEFDKVRKTHPKLDDSIISEIVFNESIQAVFTKEIYARNECTKINRTGKDFVIVRLSISDPDRLITPRLLSDNLGA